LRSAFGRFAHHPGNKPPFGFAKAASRNVCFVHGGERRQGDPSLWQTAVQGERPTSNVMSTRPCEKAGSDGYQPQQAGVTG
jgi:hypothetical protein